MGEPDRQESSGEGAKTERILEKLNPRAIRSADGIPYTSYTFSLGERKPLEVIFYRQNELPLFPSKSGKRMVVKGDRPPKRTSEGWTAFLDQGKRGEEEPAQSLFLVEANPQNLLALVVDLGIPLTAEQRKIIDELKERRIGEGGSRMIDALLAGNIIDEKGEVREKDQHEGEALYLLSLMGDKEAEECLGEKAARLKEMDAQGERGVEQELPTREKELLEGLVCVHTTSSFPQDGEVMTTFDGSGGEERRITIHFTENYLVERVEIRNQWYGVPFVIIVPFKEMMALNGAPLVLNQDDTYWEVSPGQRLKLPESVAIVRPGKMPLRGIISSLKEGEVGYKNSGILPEDLASLLTKLDEEEKEKLAEKVHQTIRKNFKDGPDQGGNIWVKPEELDNLIAVGVEEGKRLRDILLSALPRKPFPEVVRGLLGACGVEVGEKEIGEIAGQVEGVIASFIKYLAVKEKIREMGYQYTDNLGGGRISALAKSLGVDSSSHFGSVHQELESHLWDAYNCLRDESKDAKSRARNYDQELILIRGRYLPNTTPALRRMLYLLGVI